MDADDGREPGTGQVTSNVTDTALIFEGGGMRASYTSAVVVTLLAAGIHIDWVAGISAGASNAVNYLSRDATRARYSFVDFATDPRFGDWRTFVRGQGLFNAAYIYGEAGLPGGPMPFDWATFRANPARLRVGAVRCTDAQPVYWTEADMPEPADMMVRVRASSTMPGLMPFPVIDGVAYADGALGPSAGIPLDAALADGFEKFLVVLTRPREYVKRPARIPGVYHQVFRRYPAIAERILQRWRDYNEARERLFELEREGRAMLFVPDHMPVANGERRLARLSAAHELGLGQARRELPRWREFLGLDGELPRTG
ncbi:MAG TPA: patatin family protein [Propionibacteriaceae bacterium]|nr:patatin family protein [Propionibacteriaceae bacterium]